jgi:hypothetical protein
MNLIIWIQIWSFFTIWGQKNSKRINFILHPPINIVWGKKILKNSKKSKKFKTSCLFYVSYFKFVYNCFLKFVIHKINFKIVKFEIVMLTGREKTDMTVDWKVQPAAGTVVSERKRETWRDVDECEIQSDDH